MKQIGNLLFIPIPPGAHRFQLGELLTFMVDILPCCVTLPPGEWTSIGRLSELSEEQTPAEDCPYYAKCWKNHLAPFEYGNLKHPHNWDKDWSCGTRKESLRTLMAADDLPTNKDYYILKRK